MYLNTNRYGNIEVPKVKKSTSVDQMAANYKKRLEYEKYMNPKGIKQTITSRFEKPA